MIEEDYLLRQIKQLMQALLPRDDEQDEHALKEAISDGLRSLCGLSADTLSRLAPEAGRPLVTFDGRLEVDKVRAIAALLLQDARLQSDPRVARSRRVAAVGLLALLDTEDAEAVDYLDGLVRTVHLSSLHSSTLARLAGIFEAAGRYDRAEDVVFGWLPVDADAAFSAGMALYERLWALPDARLRAGGLSSDEVLESMGELQRRVGRA